MLILLLWLVGIGTAFFGLWAGWKEYQNHVWVMKERSRQAYLNDLEYRAGLLPGSWITRNPAIKLAIGLQQLYYYLQLAQLYNVSEESASQVLKFIMRTARNLEIHLNFLDDWNLGPDARTQIQQQLLQDLALLVETLDTVRRYQFWLINHAYNQSEFRERLESDIQQAKSHLDARDLLDGLESKQE